MACRAGLALLALLGLCAALGMVSRVWFARWLVRGLLAPAGRYFRHFYQLLRTPGNIAHEVGHALGYLAAGYRVAEVRFWFNDSAGRGFVRAGAPYAPWGRPWLARLIAAPAPLLSGALTLQACAHLLRVPPAMTNALTPGAELWPGPAQLQQAWEALVVWMHMPYGPLQGVGFLLLSLGIGIEIAPSREDVKALLWPAGLLAATLFCLEPAARRWPFLRPSAGWVDSAVAAGLGWIADPLWMALAVLVGVGIVLTPVRLLLGCWRA